MPAKTPIILVTAHYDSGQVKVDQHYMHSLLRCGALPLVVYELPKDGAAALARKCDGMLLTGGVDVHPARYGHMLHPKTEIDAVRDDNEYKLLAAFERAKKPVFAICRGIQVMNAYAGGTLVQHLPDCAHVRHDHSSKEYHDADIQSDSFLSVLSKEDTSLSVNTSHHQAVDAPAPGFSIAARSDDGVIEAIQRGNWWGVQWHPERMGQRMYPLFEAFVGACAKEN